MGRQLPGVKEGESFFLPPLSPLNFPLSFPTPLTRAARLRQMFDRFFTGEAYLHSLVWITHHCNQHVKKHNKWGGMIKSEENRCPDSDQALIFEDL